MLGHTANAKKSSKFEDSDSRMSRPRAVSELPQRPAQRLKAAAAAAAPGAEATGGAPRRALGVRDMAPRSPLHEARMFL
ncbi:interactor of constitutive active ROPs 1-like [Panicum miliaceum]|uniref:Interactor of constitutive active ROPs 1-like n=1 Tax=Panicum miliaceum TaxID=4540 RepID=A0A3L6RBF2_PANMI|nr:interactor of constitutive active ROPs 1-like [Panicum miliaceum]